MSRREGMSNLRYIYALGILPFHLSYALAILIDNFWFIALTPENATTLTSFGGRTKSVEFSILLFTEALFERNIGPQHERVEDTRRNLPTPQQQLSGWS